MVAPPGTGERLVETSLPNERSNLRQVKPAGEVISVPKQHPAADVVGLELVIGGGELVDHRQVEGVALRRSVQAYQQDLVAPLDGDR